MKNLKIGALILLLIFVCLVAYVYYGRDNSKEVLTESTSEIKTQLPNPEDSQNETVVVENKSDHSLTEINSEDVSGTEDEAKKYFPEDDTPYFFSVKILNEVPNNQMTYNAVLSGRFSTSQPPEALDEVSIRIISEAGALKVGDTYGLNIKYDSQHDTYVVTEVKIKPIYD